MEHRALDLARQGRLAEAQRVLSTEEYRETERAFAQGISESLALAANRLAAAQEAQVRRLWLSTLGALGGLGLTLWIWGVVLRRFRNWRRALLKAGQERALAQQALRENQKDLEARVQERTAELSAEITQRARGQQELLLFRTLIDRSNDSILVVDPDTLRILDVNERTWQNLGYSRAEMLSMTVIDIDPSLGQPKFHQQVDEALRKSGHAIFEAEHRRKDGSTFPVEANIRFIELDRRYGVSVVRDITERKQAEAELKALHYQLLETARQAGMAEVATSVLHNVGNVLNSVVISSALVADKLRSSKVGNLAKTAALLQSHAGNLPGFFAEDPKAKLLPGYLSGLAARLQTEREEVLKELASLAADIEHIKEIVAMQQRYAHVAGVIESLPVNDMLEDALRLNAAGFERHQVEVVREYAQLPPVIVEKHKVLQVLVNVLRNAKYALDEAAGAQRRLVLRTEAAKGNRVRISVIDNGVGISAENLPRIFELGFTTRKEGHGFGLHNGALAAKELGGTLSAHSDGPGRGATFVLELPCRPEERKA